MVDYIWAGLFFIGIVFAAINGTMDAVNKALFQGASDAVMICIGLISILTFWLGIMKIAEKSGLLRTFSRILEPIVLRLFPDIPKGHPALGYILSNMTANLFGLGNAATPMGIKAMEELKRLNRGSIEASRSMITLVAINTAGLTLIPTTVISIRIQYGSMAPTEIVGTTLVATICATAGAIFIDRLFYYRRLRKKRT